MRHVRGTPASRAICGVNHVVLACAMAGTLVVANGLHAQASGRSSTAWPDALLGAWRVTTGVVAPWATSNTTVVDRARYLARVVHFDAAAFRGLGPFSCASPRYVPTSMPPAGLFQGNLQSPAAAAARAIGFAPGNVRGVQLTCAAGVFEFHLADPMHLLVAIDNVIWTLDRSPGALASSSAPNGVVQALLEQHFAGAMGFDSAAVQRLRPFLTAALASRIDRYLATPGQPDEAPVIDGDPFTDTQEYPTRFSVGRATVTASVASVPVRFADGYVARQLRYTLRAASSGWRVDDIRFAEGGTFGALLQIPAGNPGGTRETVPTWAEAAWRKESIARGLERDSSLVPSIQVADFDGDGVRDVAWLVRRRTTRSRGILIVHASGRASQLCGAGVLFGNGGDNFDWMDTWQVVQRRTGVGAALLVAKSESASGRIEFRAGRYRWVQVGD